MTSPANLSQVHIINHPLVVDSLAHLRNKDTQIEEYRYHSNKICRFLFGEALRGLNLETEMISTPLTETEVQKFQRDVVVLPVLRAGLAMMLGALELLPKVKVGFIGLERDEKTAVAHEYYWKVPKITPQTLVIITDPMLATGGSTLHLLRKVKSVQPEAEVRVVCVLAAPEGIKAVHKEFPNLEIYTSAVDDHLDERKYIVPGLGDYGDRYFGTT